MPIMEPASEYVPRVTRSLIKSPTNFPHFETDAIHFLDSDTSIFMRDRYLLISFNGGKSWETVDVVGNDAYSIEIDPFHKERAFIRSKHEKFYVTEDRGRNWKELPVPKVPSEYFGTCSIRTHPIDKKLLFFIFQDYPRKYYHFSDIYASNNRGKSFRYLSPPVNYHETNPPRSFSGWHFAVPPQESMIGNNEIYYVHRARYDTPGRCGGRYPERIITVNLESGEKRVFNQVYTFFFYDTDLSETKNVSHESNDSPTDNISIFPTSVIVLASEKEDDEKIRKLWISKDGPFKPVPLPDEIASLQDACFFSGDDQKRILLTVEINERNTDDTQNDTRLLVLDISSLNFTWDSTSYYSDLSESFKELGNPGTTQRIITPYPSKADCCCRTTRDFNDAESLMFIINGFLHVSFDSGESWQLIDEVGNDANSVRVDPFHKGRAFVASNSGKLFVTEDRGSSWREFHVPKAMHGHINLRELQTHPIDRKLLLFPDGRVIWTSTDGGQSFSCISPPVNLSEAPPNFELLRCTLHLCHFAVCSKESTLQNNGIYYIFYSESFEKSSATKNKVKCREIYSLFYTPDFGKTTKVFDEWKGSSVNRIFIFPSSVFVLTAEFPGKNKKLWISKGEGFESVPLPKEVLSLETAEFLSQNDYSESPWGATINDCKDDYKRLLLTVRVNDCENPYLLILDPLTLNFSFRGPVPWSCEDLSRGNVESFGQLGNLKGTIWAVYLPGYSYATKASFDNGKSWTNVRVIDPSGNHRHLFKCDANDVEQCRFQEDLEPCECCFPYASQNEPTAGIIMKRGTVGRRTKGTNVMTFISRDGGVSWEVAFEFPVYAEFLDFGNIIVAMRYTSEGSETDDEHCYSGFYFSVDQGRSWNEYRFAEPIESYDFSIYSFGLKVLIDIQDRREERTPPEYGFYSIDFSNIFGGAACTEDDLERWYLYDGKYVDGVRYSFDRRKPDAKCLVRKTFEKLELHEERCDT